MKSQILHCNDLVSVAVVQPEYWFVYRDIKIDTHYYII